MKLKLLALSIAALRVAVRVRYRSPRPRDDQLFGRYVRNKHILAQISVELTNKRMDDNDDDRSVTSPPGGTWGC